MSELGLDELVATLQLLSDEELAAVIVHASAGRADVCSAVSQAWAQDTTADGEEPTEVRREKMRRADMTPEQRQEDNRARRARAATQAAAKLGGASLSSLVPRKKLPGNLKRPRAPLGMGVGPPEKQFRRMGMSPAPAAMINPIFNPMGWSSMFQAPAAAANHFDLWQAPIVAGKGKGKFHEKPRSLMTPEERAEDNHKRRLRKMHANGIAPPAQVALPEMQLEVGAGGTKRALKPRSEMTPEERKADNQARRLRAAAKGSV